MPSWTWAVAALSVGLAMDATAVAATRGLTASRARVREGLLLALTFGAFQGAMTLGGWALGRVLGRWIEDWDHWIAFGLLVLIGGTMLHEAYASDGESDPPPLTVLSLFGLGLATSIDAFAAGVTLPTIGAPVATSVLAIGATTAVLSGLGFAAGRTLGAALGRRLDAVGGVVLVLLGLKILLGGG